MSSICCSSGDVEETAQQELGPIRADVLKVAHHGAATSDIEWLVDTGASLAVISVGPNDFGHPVPRGRCRPRGIGRPRGSEPTWTATSWSARPDRDLTSTTCDTPRSWPNSTRRHGSRSSLATPHLEFDGTTTAVMGVVNVSPESRNRQTVAATPAEAGQACREPCRSRRRPDRPGSAVVALRGGDADTRRGMVPAGTGFARGPRRRVARLGRYVETRGGETCHRRGCVAGQRHGGLRDPAMVELLAETGVAGVAMRIDGTDPHRVRPLDTSGDVPGRIFGELARLLEDLERAGVTNVLLDPGIAINYPGDYAAYTRLQLDVIRRLAELRRLGRPVLGPDSPQADAGGHPWVRDSVPRARRRHDPSPRCRRCGDARGAVREEDALSRLLHVKGPGRRRRRGASGDARAGHGLLRRALGGPRGRGARRCPGKRGE